MRCHLAAFPLLLTLAAPSLAQPAAPAEPLDGMMFIRRDDAEHAGWTVGGERGKPRDRRHV